MFGVSLKWVKLIIKYSTFSLVLNYWWPCHWLFHLTLIRPSLVGCWFEADIDVLELAELNIIFSFTEYISFYKIFAGVLERQPVLQKIGDRRQELSRQHFTSNVNSILFIIHFSNSIKILVYKISFTRKTIFSVFEIRNIFHNSLDFFPSVVDRDISGWINNTVEVSSVLSRHSPWSWMI